MFISFIHTFMMFSAFILAICTNYFLECQFLIFEIGSKDDFCIWLVKELYELLQELIVDARIKAYLVKLFDVDDIE